MAIVESQTTVPADATCNWPQWPAYGLIDDLLPTIERWAGAGHRVAIVTLVHIVGSSPRPLGSEMAVCDNGEVAGYVSGGCVEGAVAAEALAAMDDGQPRLLDYGAGSPVLDVQLTCGGRIGIFVRVLADAGAYARRLRQARTSRQPLDVHIDLDSGNHHFAMPTRSVEDALDGTFVKTFLPLARLIVIGSDPITVALCQLAPHFGFEVGLLRPYGPADPPEGVQPFHYDTQSISRAIKDVPIDTWTAVYTLTHNIDYDQHVLLRALPSSAFSVGVLGSRHKITERSSRLAEAGISAKEMERLSTPAGLDINGENPSEIALSILAEIVAKRPRLRQPLLQGAAPV